MRNVVALCLLALLTAIALGDEATPKHVSVLVVYYSKDGHTRAMAEAVRNGAQSVEGITVSLMDVSQAKPADVLAADAVIVGSPVYKANVAPPVQEFINSWPIRDPALHDKLGAAFVSAGNISGGEELTQMSILHSMLVCQMIVVGGPGAQQPFGAAAITGEKTAAVSGKEDDGKLVSEYYLKRGEALGRRVAQLAFRLAGTKQNLS